jgi:hypothetical protein
LDVADKAKLRILERRVEASCRLPPRCRSDDSSVDFRNALIERAGLGIEELSDHAILAIMRRGYDAFFVEMMNSHNKIGLRAFYKLAGLGRLDLTTEYIVFNHFRERLNQDSRRKIAALLLEITNYK